MKHDKLTVRQDGNSVKLVIEPGFELKAGVGIDHGLCFPHQEAFKIYQLALVMDSGAGFDMATLWLSNVWLGADRDVHFAQLTSVRFELPPVKNVSIW